MKLISIIVPTHNEAANIAPLYQRLVSVFSGIAGYDFELIFSDDSQDETPREIAQLHQKDPRVKLVRLSRRFSQAIALSAGIDRARGEAVVLMDADLQDPPEAIPRLIELWEAGNEVVYVQRPSTSSSALYRFFARVFYRLLNKLSSLHIPADSGEFRLLDRRVVAFLRNATEHTRYIRGLTVWPGLRQASIQIERGPRERGDTKYNLKRSFLVAVDGMVSFSVLPLRFAALLGALIAIVSLLAGLAYTFLRLLYPGIFGAGWTSLFVIIAFMGGVQLMFLGVLGEYIGRIFVEVQNRPLYWVDYELGFDQPRPVPGEKGTEQGAWPGITRNTGPN